MDNKSLRADREQQRKWLMTQIEKDNLQNTFKTKSLKPSKINLSIEFLKYLSIRGQYLLMWAYFQHLFKCVTLWHYHTHASTWNLRYNYRFIAISHQRTCKIASKLWALWGWWRKNFRNMKFCQNACNIAQQLFHTLPIWKKIFFENPITFTPP